MLSSQCFQNPPTLSSTCGAGTVQEFGGLQTYITDSPDSKLAIIFIADAFGTNLSSFSLYMYMLQYS